MIVAGMPAGKDQEHHQQEQEENKGTPFPSPARRRLW